MGSRELAIRHLPMLRANLKSLDEVSLRIFRSPINIGRNNHLRFMLVSYAIKQIEHSRSLLRLAPSVDTTLIARSMLEGLMQLLWAMKQPRRQPLMWRAFAFVLDGRLIQSQRAQGLNIDPKVEHHVRLGLRCYGKWFLTKEARRSASAGKPLPADPYTKNWYGERETDIFQNVGGQVLLESAYSPFSEWHHWRPGAFGRLMSFDEQTSTFAMSAVDPNQVAMALTTGFQCLWQTMRLLNSRCRLGIGRDLVELRRRQLSLGK